MEDSFSIIFHVSFYKYINKYMNYNAVTFTKIFLIFLFY